MYGQVHYNRVLYWGRPRQGAQFRQIVVVELEQFQVRVLDGEVIQTEPQFTANNPDAAYELHPGLQSALADADKEYSASLQAGWTPYVGP
jgi:hypothetical protein